MLVPCRTKKENATGDEHFHVASGLQVPYQCFVNKVSASVPKFVHTNRQLLNAAGITMAIAGSYTTGISEGRWQTRNFSLS